MQMEFDSLQIVEPKKEKETDCEIDVSNFAENPVNLVDSVYISTKKF